MRLGYSRLTTVMERKLDVNKVNKRSPDELHKMARHSVEVFLSFEGPSTTDELKRTGLVEINLRRALQQLHESGRVSREATGRWYLLDVTNTRTD